MGGEAGVEEIARATAIRITDAILDHVYVDGENVSASVLHPAAEIIAEIIAPILAEKERARDLWQKQATLHAEVGESWQSRALAQKPLSLKRRSIAQNGLIRLQQPSGRRGSEMGKLTDDQIKALWRNVAAKADFSRGPAWRTPIYRGITDGYEHARNSDPTALTPPDEMYVEFRKEVGVYGVRGSMGHRVTRVIGNGVIVEEVHHENRPELVPFDHTP